MKKRICIPVFSVFLILMTSVSAFAAGKKSFLQNYFVTGDGQQTLAVLCSELDEESNVEFWINNQAAEAERSGIIEESVPKTVYCMVDVSGSMSGDQMEQAKTVLRQISAGLGEQDNMVIGTLGNDLSRSEFMTEAEERENYINAIEAGTEDTNLYAGIVESIDVLQSNPSVHDAKYLIILSDGQDDQKSGITQSEAENAVIQSDIPVYTVAVLPEELAGSSLTDRQKEQIEYAKELGNFARNSAGGIHYAPVIDGVSIDAVGEAILQSIGRSVVMILDTQGVAIDPAGSSIELKAIYTDAAGAVYEDTLVIDHADVQWLAQAADPETEEDPETDEDPDTGSVREAEQPETGQTEQNEDRNLTWVWILVLAVIVLAAVAAVVVKKKRAVPAAAEREENGPDGKSGNGEGEEISGTDADSGEEASDPTADDREDISTPETVTLQFNAVGYEHISRTLTLETGREYTVGRSQKADLIFDSDDKKISAVHCSVKWMGDKLYVKDQNSTNGTFVNGVPIKQVGRVAVHRGDTIRIGTYEYRIV